LAGRRSRSSPALQGRRARKGVFLTTASFSTEVVAFASGIDSKIVLIDGPTLAKYMIDNSLGCSPSQTHEVKRIDSDLFLEEQGGAVAITRGAAFECTMSPPGIRPVLPLITKRPRIDHVYLGTSVPVEKVLDAALEHAAKGMLISTIITHNEIHRLSMEKLADLAVEKGVRDKLLLISGGTQVTDELARE
jgi:hypothetical protein